MRISEDASFRKQIIVATLMLTAHGLFGCHLDAAPFEQHGIKWSRDINQAIAQAKQLNKPLLLKVSTDWCGYCKKMERETFSDASIIAKVSESFIPVYVDGDKQKALVQQLGVRSYPTTVIVSPTQQVLANITGFRSARQLATDLVKFSPAQQSPSSQAIAQAPRSQMRLSIFGDNCPVSPIETGKFVPANTQYATTFRGYKLNFASKEYLDSFSRNPTKYWPVADGMCVVTAAHGKGARMGELNNGALYQGRIWFFADQQTRASFEAEPAKYFNWLKQRTQAVAAQQNPTGRTR